MSPEVANLSYSKTGDGNVKIVVAVHRDEPTRRRYCHPARQPGDDRVSPDHGAVLQRESGFPSGSLPPTARRRPRFPT